MPVLMAILGIIGAAYFWTQRARNARYMLGDVGDMANDVRLATRRFGFTRKMNVHPVESIELDDLPTAEQRQLLQVQLRSKLRADADEAEEMEVLGRWFMSECGGADPAIARLSRKLYKIGGAEQMEPLMDVLKSTVKDGLSDRQRDALEDITRAMRVR